MPQQTTVDLNFASIDVGSPPGQVSFNAPALSDGSTWQLTLNGTTYSSDTPWINVTTHTGNYSFAVGSAESANGSVGYAAVGVNPYINVVVGDTYTVNYVVADKVTIEETYGGTVSPNGVQFYAPGSTTSALVPTASPNFYFVGWSGSGVGSYSGTTTNPQLTVGGPIVETANFAPLPTNRFDLNFTETGLPSGLPWQVDVGLVSQPGTPYSSTTSSLVVPYLDAAPTHYHYSVPYVYGTDPSNATRYVSETQSQTVVAGTGFDNALVYQEQHYLTLESSSGGSSSAQVGNGAAGGSTWFTTGELVTLSASYNTGYSFAGWVGTGPGSYTGTNPTAPITPSGSITELATFTVILVPLPPTFNVLFHLARSVQAGTDWSITVGGTTYASTGTELNLTALPLGTITAKVPVAYSPDGLSQYTPQNASVTVHVGPTVQPVSVTFSTAYWVYLATVGPGTLSSGSNWVPAGQALSILATANSGDVLTSWTGTGTGAYSGSGEFANVTVTAPITEVATFGAVASTPQQTVTSTPFLTSYAGVAILAIVGLILGAIFGLIWGRGRSAPPPPPPEGGEPMQEYSEGPRR